MRHRLLPSFCVLAGVLAWGAASGGDAGRGKALFAQQCVTCHNAGSAEKKLGPGLKGLFKAAKLANGKKATEQTIRAQIDNGGNGMPPYKDMFSEQEKDDLIAFLKTL